MAETIHLFLKANDVELEGESTQTSLGREGSIECVWYEQTMITAREAGTGLATGRRQYPPLLIRKRIDKASPLIMKAAAENQVVEGVFKFFRPSRKGDGTTEQFYTVEFKQGRINTIRQFVQNSFAPALSNDPPLEEVTFVFHTISWTITDGGVQHEDSWSEQR